MRRARKEFCAATRRKSIRTLFEQQTEGFLYGQEEEEEG
jgi:hypothetical protein